MFKKAKNRAKVSSKHRVTIPAEAFRATGFEAGDMLIDELVDCYSGSLTTGGNLREQVEGLREEWR